MSHSRSRLFAPGGDGGAAAGGAVTGGAVTGGAVTGGAVTGGAIMGGAGKPGGTCGVVPDWKGSVIVSP
jgi:hypothetical protein